MGYITRLPTLQHFFLRYGTICMLATSCAAETLTSAASEKLRVSGEEPGEVCLTLDSNTINALNEGDLAAVVTISRYSPSTNHTGLFIAPVKKGADTVTPIHRFAIYPNQAFNKSEQVEAHHFRVPSKIYLSLIPARPSCFKIGFVQQRDLSNGTADVQLTIAAPPR
jgi:hypothetical protein